MDNYDKFIGKLYDILLSSDIISYEDKPKDLKEKKERLEKYLDKLGRVQSKAMSKEEHIDTLKKLYYDRYVIKRENIPESYFKSLEKRYLDEGYGHHNLVNPDNGIDKELKEQHINVIIREQKDSLDVWLNYFLSKDSNYLPMWAKVWAFQGMLGIGNLNKEKDGYGRRSNTAVNPFINFDSEILGKCVELVKDTFDNKEVTDKEIDKLVSSGSFAKLYGKLLANKKQLKVSSNEGIWIKYNYESEEEANEKVKNGIEPEYLKLYNSLQGYNTGWCTAGSKETAKSQICGGSSYMGGDFYVYYTKDKNGEYKIPRIAIRMDREQIGEIRGIAEDQNIESNMEKVLEEKLKEFSDGKSYQKKIHDMKILTEIYNNSQKRELTKEELSFLYEKNEEILGFGYQKDPRIYEIKDSRDKRKDLSLVYNCDESEIGLIEEDLYKKQLVYYNGYIDNSMYYKLKKVHLELPMILNAGLLLQEIENDKDLILPQSVGGSLDLSSLTSVNGLVLPKRIGNSIKLGRLTVAKNLSFPQSIDGYLNLRSLTSAEGLTLPQSVGGCLDLRSLISAKGLILPQSVSGALDLRSLISAKGLTLPEHIGSYLDLRSLTSAEGLTLPQSVGGYLNLSGLTSAEGLILPPKMTGNLDLDCLISAKGLTLPEHIGGDLDLSSLTSVEGLVLPKSIGGILNLNSLTSAEGLILPQSVGEHISLRNLASLKGLSFPQNINFTIVYKEHVYSLEELKELQKQEDNNKKLIKDNRKGFTTGIFTITFVLFVTILSILIGMLLVK